MLEAAYDRAPTEREVWLEQACVGDAALLARTRALLAAETRAARFLSTERHTGEDLTPIAVPDRIGPYRVGRLIGLGGMGAVYRGERDDGQFDQLVAIKLIRPGVLSAQATERFASERRMLARMRHPGVAQLFDGGMLADGTSYIVMEFVVGTAIDEFAATRALAVRAIVKLFRQVVGAVAHAHGSLVVHADIKPGNVIVGDDGTAKLLDFGIAQSLDAAADTASQQPVTPDYAAPERLAGASATVRGDVYALGTLLFELLTRERPHALADLAPAARLPAVEAATRPIPSRTALDWADRAWRRALTGDLDAVVAKAMHTDPARRYETAAALRDDLDRWLDRKPVRARGGGWRYVATSFVRRNRLAVGAAAAIIVGLVVALAATSTLYLRAERERAASERRFDEVRALSRFLLFDLYDRLEHTPRSLATRARVAAEAQIYLDRLSRVPGASFEVRLETARGFGRLAAAQGRPGAANLGQNDAAWRNYATAEAMLTALAAERPDRTDIRRALADVLLDQTWIEASIRTALLDATRRMARLRPVIAQLRAEAPADRDVALLRWRELVHLAELPQWSGDYPEGETRARAAIAFGNAVTRNRSLTIPELIVMARAYQTLGEARYFGGGEAPAALGAHAREAAVVREASRRAPGSIAVDRQLTRSLYNHGVTLAELRDPRGLDILNEAEAAAARVIAFEPADENGHRQRRTVTRAKGEALGWLGRHAEAYPLYEADTAERLALWRARPADTSRARDYATSVGAMGMGYGEGGRFEDACRAYATAFTTFRLIEARGQLTAWDRGNAIKNFERAVAEHCRTANPPRFK